MADPACGGTGMLHEDLADFFPRSFHGQPEISPILPEIS